MINKNRSSVSVNCIVVSVNCGLVFRNYNWDLIYERNVSAFRCIVLELIKVQIHLDFMNNPISLQIFLFIYIFMFFTLIKNNAKNLKIPQSSLRKFILTTSVTVSMTQMIE